MLHRKVQDRFRRLDFVDVLGTAVFAGMIGGELASRNDIELPETFQQGDRSSLAGNREAAGRLPGPRNTPRDWPGRAGVCTCRRLGEGPDGSPVR
jgi:hypothetical protein